jgi:hypothetical protein
MTPTAFAAVVSSPSWGDRETTQLKWSSTRCGAISRFDSFRHCVNGVRLLYLVRCTEKAREPHLPVEHVTDS